MTAGHVPRGSTRGSRVEEIAALTDRNRTCRDPELERRLVRLRHDAFDDLDRSSPPGDWWPSVTPDGAGDGCPSPLSPEELSPESIRAGIVRDGYVHVRGLVPALWVDRLVDGIDRAIAAAEAFASGMPPSDTTPWFEPFRPADRYGEAMRRQVGNRRKWVREAGGVWTADSPRMMFEFFELLDDRGLLRLITAYLDERPALAVDKCTLRRVGVDTSTDWHQDGAFLGGGIRTVNVWLSLSHCGTDAPGLDIVPTRLDRVVETGTEGATFSWSVGPSVVERVAGAAGVRRPVFAPGDVMFFDDLFLHRTAVDPAMTRERYAIETWFFAPSVYPEKYVPLMA